MGRAEEDLPEPRPLEESCGGPMFPKESNGTSKHMGGEGQNVPRAKFYNTYSQGCSYITCLVSVTQCSQFLIICVK